MREDHRLIGLWDCSVLTIPLQYIQSYKYCGGGWMRIGRVVFDSGCGMGETACLAMMRLYVGKV